jgi:penicillin amidase
MGFASAALKADVQDIFLEEFSGLEKNKYKTSSGYKEAKIISEPIAVRFTGILPYQVVLTNHGPALTKQDNFSVCLMWTGNSPGSAFDSLLEISEAKTMEEVSEACKNYRGSPQIYLFADRTGNIALSGAGLIPIRSNNGNGMLLQSGPASSGQWTGQLNTASIISSINPKDGILVSANEKPAGINSQLLLGHQWCAPYRAQRARNILKLTKDKNLTFDYPEANETMTDEEASIFALVKKRINEAAIALDIIDDNTQSTQKLLSKWNGQLKGNQPEALIYEAFLHHLVYQIVINKVQDQKLTNTYFKQYPMWILLGEYYLANKPDNLLPPNEANHNSFIISTLNLALQQVRQKTNSFNPEQWHWDSFHLAKFSNILVSGLPWLKPIINKTYTNLGGDENAIYSVNTMASGSALNYAADSGPVARILINMKNDDQIYQCLSGGQNGHFFSKSQNNELTTWSNLDILPVAVSQKRQESLVQHRLQLTSIYSNQ